MKLLMILLITAAIPLAAQNFPSLDAAPEAYEHSRRMAANNVNWIHVAEAALWASSVNAGPGAEAKAAAYLDRIKTAAADLAAANPGQSQKERGEAALVFLHKNFLKSYSEFQTRVDEVFVSGRYNCVSSAVLYIILCNSLGIETEGVMTKDHAFALIKAGTETIDVETTNRYGFDPGNRKEFHDAFGKTTGFAYVPAANYRDRINLNAAELVSLILSNRIAIHEKANRFADAVPLAINRVVFLSGVSAEKNSASQNNASGRNVIFEDPQKDMMNRLFNLGAHYIKTGKDDDAIAWADYAGKRYPGSREDYLRWQELAKAAVNNKLVKLIKAKKTSDARSALTALKEKLSGEIFTELDVMVLEAEAGDRVNSIRNPGDAEAALAFLAEEWERLPSGRREEIRNAAILAEADRFGKSKNWLGGMNWLKSAMEKYGANAKMEAAYRTMRQNRVSELHNEFALLYNKKDYTGAKASVMRSLEEFPEEKQLIQDLALVEKILQR